MNSEHLLAKIYYEIGKQNTNFALQHSRKEEDEVIWTKRKTFLELDPVKDKWFIDHANHRQILKNEIIFDFDRPIKKEEALSDPQVQKLLARFREESWSFALYHTGSKGIHLHVYWNALILMRKEEWKEGEDADQKQKSKREKVSASPDLGKGKHEQPKENTMDQVACVDRARVKSRFGIKGLATARTQFIHSHEFL